MGVDDEMVLAKLTQQEASAARAARELLFDFPMHNLLISLFCFWWNLHDNTTDYNICD
jgi:hypothetical protein